MVDDHFAILCKIVLFEVIMYLL